MNHKIKILQNMSKCTSRIVQDIMLLILQIVPKSLSTSWQLLFFSKSSYTPNYWIIKNKNKNCNSIIMKFGIFMSYFICICNLINQFNIHIKFNSYIFFKLALHWIIVEDEKGLHETTLFLVVFLFQRLWTQVLVPPSQAKSLCPTPLYISLSFMSLNSRIWKCNNFIESGHNKN